MWDLRGIRPGDEVPASCAWKFSANWGTLNPRPTGLANIFQMVQVHEAICFSTEPWEHQVELVCVCVCVCVLGGALD